MPSSRPGTSACTSCSSRCRATSCSRAVVDGRADIAAAALTVTPERQKLVDFSQADAAPDVDEIVVTGPGAPEIAAVDDLVGQGSLRPEVEQLLREPGALNAQLKSQGQAAGRASSSAPEELEDEDLLEMVNAGLVKITVVDNYLAEFWKTAAAEPRRCIRDVAVRTGGQIARGDAQEQPAADGGRQRAGSRSTGRRPMFGNMMTQRYLKSTKFAKSATSTAEMKRFQPHRRRSSGSTATSTSSITC